MEAEVQANYSCVGGRSFSDITIDAAADDYLAFSDCNSDRSGEFAAAASPQKRLLLSCAMATSDDLIDQLVADLESSSVDKQKRAAMEIRLLAKNNPENRIRIARAGAIKPLISLLSSSDLQLQEYSVTAVLNLSLCEDNKGPMVSAGAILPLIRTLETGTSTARENAACALLRLSQVEEYKVLIGRSGAIPPLVHLLENGSSRGKKDACTALYSLCSARENKARAIEAGVMRPLVELMADSGVVSMADKAAFVAGVLAAVAESVPALVEEGGIPVLVEMVEVGTQRQKEVASGILLQVCEQGAVYCTMVAREGAIPPLVALSQSGTIRAKRKAVTLIELLRRPRSANAAALSTSASD